MRGTDYGIRNRQMITISDLQFIYTSVALCKMKFFNVRGDMICHSYVEVPGTIQHSWGSSSLSNIGMARRVTRIIAPGRIVCLVVSLPTVDILMTLTVKQLTHGVTSTSVIIAIERGGIGVVGGYGGSDVESRRRPGGGTVCSKHRRTRCIGCICRGRRKELSMTSVVMFNMRFFL